MHLSVSKEIRDGIYVCIVKLFKKQNSYILLILTQDLSFVIYPTGGYNSSFVTFFDSCNLVNTAEKIITFIKIMLPTVKNRKLVLAGNC